MNLTAIPIGCADSHPTLAACLSHHTEEAAIAALSSSGKKGRKPSKLLHTDLFRVVKLVMDRDLDPCIVFSFSKKECETYALQMAKLDFNSEDEKAVVEQVFLNAMEALSEEDKVWFPLVLQPLLASPFQYHPA